MQNDLALDQNDFDARAVSPLRELGAYEALWDRPGASFKKIADMFRERPGGVPSDFVSPGDADAYARKVLEILRRAGIEKFGVRVHGAGEYPRKLRDAVHPIELLYFQGWWDLVETRCVAVVGARNPTEEGQARAKRLVKLLVDDGYTIVSGLARGIDTVAHTTAIESGGRTIAVIGTPICVSYPKENVGLQQQIAKEYLLISQVPVCRYSQQSPKQNRLFFPERNVTMSALTEATVIVEAGETSGTLVQARAAFQQGRKLFILESCFQNKDLTWPARFAREGAIRVREYEDIEKHLVSDQANQDRRSDTSRPFVP